MSKPGNSPLNLWSNWKIWPKLNYGFGLFLGLTLIIVAVCLISLHNVQNTFQSALDQGVGIERLASNIETELLEAQHNDKDFLLNWQSEGFDTAYNNYVVANQQHVANIGQALDTLEGLQADNSSASSAQIAEDVKTLRANIDIYEQEFQKTVDLIKQSGFENTELAELDPQIKAGTAAYRTAAQNIEADAAHIIVLSNQIVNEKVAQTYLLTTRTNFNVGILLIVAVLGSFGLAYLLARQITKPMQAIAEAARQVAAGDLKARVQVQQGDEIGQTAQAFNQMTDQLSQTFNSLEAQVIARTKRLENLVNLSERMTALLNLEELLAEVVNYINDNFDYYHTHIYLLDPKKENLVVVESSGSVGAQMKAQRHLISLKAPTSLVARAARTGQLVRVENVHESAGWLPNPLLPDTQSEIAAPIISQGEVVGVLDVQENKIAGLDEGDANLLRSLANQIAIAIHNTQLFEEVNTALDETQAAQERYLEHAWQKTRITTESSQYLYKESTTIAVDEAQRQMFDQARQEALLANHPRVVSLGDGSDQTVLVAPIQLGGKHIGDFQLHASGLEAWTEDDLVVIEQLLDQLAQSAENLRLFEETREQASFDQVVGEITQKLRQAPNLETLAKTAAEELGRVLETSHSLVKLGVSPES